MLAGAVYPILLRQDPRFFRQGTGTLRSRIRHALLASVICRGDSGRRQPNYSNVLGNFSAGLISNLYYPSEDTGIGLSLVNSSIQTAEGAAGNIALEFSPDIGAYLRRYRGHHRIGPPPRPLLRPPPAPEPLHQPPLPPLQQRRRSLSCRRSVILSEARRTCGLHRAHTRPPCTFRTTSIGDRIESDA